MILALVEPQLDELSLEALTFARRLGSPLRAVVVGDAPTDRLATHGVSVVHVVRHERLTDYAPEAWAQSVVELIGSLEPEAVVAPASERGSEVMAHVAARLDAPLAANCIDAQPGEPYRVTRLRWGGSLLEEAELDAPVKLLTVAPHVVAAEEVTPPALTVEELTPALADKDFRVQVTERIEAATGKVSLADARVVVGGGRGVGSAEGFAALEELADLLDGAVGGSRVVTNLGWRSHSDQIGQTGARIAPDLYIACGISGAIQHMVGCKGAKRLLAINKDAHAPIVAKADYAVIGDLNEVLPALTAEVRKAKGLVGSSA
jgi:electron transfer flavoprotein alpha subunit